MARVGSRNSSQTWEVRDLFTREADDENCASLLREIGSAAIEQQVMRVFLRAIGLPPVPQMVKEPRANPYVFWWPEEVPGRGNGKGASAGPGKAD